MIGLINRLFGRSTQKRSRPPIPDLIPNPPLPAMMAYTQKRRYTKSLDQPFIKYGLSRDLPDIERFVLTAYENRETLDIELRQIVANAAAWFFAYGLLDSGKNGTMKRIVDDLGQTALISYLRKHTKASYAIDPNTGTITITDDDWKAHYILSTSGAGR